MNFQEDSDYSPEFENSRNKKKTKKTTKKSSPQPRKDNSMEIDDDDGNKRSCFVFIFQCELGCGFSEKSDKKRIRSRKKNGDSGTRPKKKQRRQSSPESILPKPFEQKQNQDQQNQHQQNQQPQQPQQQQEEVLSPNFHQQVLSTFMNGHSQTETNGTTNGFGPAIMIKPAKSLLLETGRNCSFWFRKFQRMFFFFISALVNSKQNKYVVYSNCRSN